MKHDLQVRSEKIVLYSLLMIPDNTHEIISKLTSDVFIDIGRRSIFDYAVELYTENKGINTTSILSKILSSNKNNNQAKDSVIDIINGVSLFNLNEVSDAIWYLTAQSVKSEQILVADHIKTMVKSDNYDPSNVLDYIQNYIVNNKFKSLRKQKTRCNEEILGDLDAAIELANNGGGVNGIPTGYHEFDKIISGMHNTNFIIIAGRPASGKTQFAIGILRNASIMGNYKGLMVSCEMTDTQLMKRIVCVDAGIKGYSLKYGNLSNEERMAYSQSKKRIRNSNMKIIHGSFYIDEVVAEIHKEKNANGLDYVIVDYLQKVKSKKNNSKNSEVEDVAGKLKDLANDLNIPIIALAQLSRSVEHRTDKKPMLSDLRDSGSIEQDADIVGFLYRPSYYMDEAERMNSPMANDGYVIIAKHRDGELRDILMRFDSEIPKWSNTTDPKGLTPYRDEDEVDTGITNFLF